MACQAIAEAKQSPRNFRFLANHRLKRLGKTTCSEDARNTRKRKGTAQRTVYLIILEMDSAVERSNWAAVSTVLRLMRPETTKNNFH
jgi:hypothetical protein